MAINDFIYNQPISLIISILIVSGLYFVGVQLLKKSKIGEVISLVSNYKYQAVVFSTYLLILVIYPLIFFFKINNFYLKLLGILLILAGILNIFTTLDLKKIITNIKKSTYQDKILIVSIILLFFWSLGPITNADSLAYHSRVSLNYLNYKEIYDILYFQSFLFGPMDSLTIFSFVNGAEQLFPIIQFFSIIGLIGILKKNANDKDIFFLLSLIILSSPLLLHYVGSLKPDIILISGSAIAFSLILKINKKINLSYYLFIFGAILTINLISKLSFILSGSVLLLFLFFQKEIFNNSNKTKFFLISSLYMSLYVIPFLFLKSSYFQEINISNFFFPIPGDFPSQNNFINHLKGPPINFQSFLGFFIPYKMSLISQVLGYSIFIAIFLFFKFFNKKERGGWIIIILFLITIIFSQSRARFYYELFILISIYLCFIINKLNIRNINYLKLILLPQFCIVNLFLIYGILTISIGSINESLKEKVLINNAYGYNTFKWLNSNVPDNSKLISTHRSISFSNFETISSDFIQFMRNKNDKDKKLMELLKEKKPSHIFFSEDNYFYIDQVNLEKCLGNQIKKSKNILADVSRNPFNKKVTKNLYLYEFQYNKLPDCYRH
tara:strand:- start:7273 stop:9105 length:1833 start_codon:yes stop_codon:yes gene_type:complete